MDEDGDGNISKSEFSKVAAAFQLGSEFSAESMAGGLEGMAGALSLMNTFSEGANVFSSTLKMGASGAEDTASLGATISGTVSCMGLKHVRGICVLNVGGGAARRGGGVAEECRSAG